MICLDYGKDGAKDEPFNPGMYLETVSCLSLELAGGAPTHCAHD